MTVLTGDIRVMVIYGIIMASSILQHVDIIMNRDMHHVMVEYVAMATTSNVTILTITMVTTIINYAMVMVSHVIAETCVTVAMATTGDIFGDGLRE